MAEELIKLEQEGVPLNGDLLLPFIKKSGTMSKKAYCIVHKRYCNIDGTSPSDDSELDEDPATFHIAGFPCVSWSPQGSRLTTNGSDFKHWSCWICHRRECED